MEITVEQPQKHITVLTINRPQVLNALNWAAMDAFGTAVTEIQGSKHTRALIITGAGDRAFCSGGDLREMHNQDSEGYGQVLSEKVRQALEMLENLPFPVIGAINGLARGGGVEIALACDLLVMDAQADMGLTQIKLALTPGWGSGQRLLHRVGYNRALYLLTTGNPIDAKEAYAIGLVEQIAPPGTALQTALSLAKDIADNDPEAVQAIKQFLQAGRTRSPAEALRMELETFPSRWASDAHNQRVAAFLNRKENR